MISLTFLLKAYSHELKDVFKHSVNQLNDFVEEFLNFDIENMMVELQIEEEMEDEYEDEEDYFT